jgi:small subunit ribosomal protein S20
MKTASKKAVESIGEGDEGKTEALLRQAIAKIDKAAAKGVIHKNEARRRASRLATKVRKAVSQKPGAERATG